MRDEGRDTPGSAFHTPALESVGRCRRDVEAMNQILDDLFPESEDDRKPFTREIDHRQYGKERG